MTGGTAKVWIDEGGRRVTAGECPDADFDAMRTAVVPGWRRLSLSGSTCAGGRMKFTLVEGRVPTNEPAAGTGVILRLVATARGPSPLGDVLLADVPGTPGLQLLSRLDPKDADALETAFACVNSAGGLEAVGVTIPIIGGGPAELRVRGVGAARDPHGLDVYVMPVGWRLAETVRAWVRDAAAGELKKSAPPVAHVIGRPLDASPGAPCAGDLGPGDCDPIDPHAGFRDLFTWLRCEGVGPDRAAEVALGLFLAGEGG